MENYKYFARQIIALFIFFLLFAPVLKAQQTKTEIVLTLLSRWDDDHLQRSGTQTFNDIWGWADGKGREYAIMGALDSIYFIEVTNPKKPVVRARQAGRVDRSINRDFDTYLHYAYAVADAGYSSLQIFDLQYLPDSVHKVYDSDSLSFRCHTIFRDGNRLYMGTNREWIYSDSSRDALKHSMTVLSLEDPEKPKLLGHLVALASDSTFLFEEVHDMYARNDTVYCSSGNNGLFIYDYKDPENPELITSITPPYPHNGYNHSSWLTADGRHLVFADENHYRKLKLYDISQIQDSSNHNPDLYFKSFFGSNDEKGSIAHNPYIKGDYLYVSYYHDGLLVYNIADPLDVRKVAQYDTYWQNDTVKPTSTDPMKPYKGFEGMWSVYPFLPSGNIIASDMTNGLFVFSLDTFPVFPDTIQIKLLSNPFNDILKVQVNSNIPVPVRATIYDVAGRFIYQEEKNYTRGVNTYTFQPETPLANGMYILHISVGHKSAVFKIIKV